MFLDEQARYIPDNSAVSLTGKGPFKYDGSIEDDLLE